MSFENENENEIKINSIDNKISDLYKKLNKLVNKLESLEKIPIYKFALREDLKDDNRFLPTKAESLATGWDVRAAQFDRKPLVIKPGSYAKIPLGFRVFCPEGWWYILHPRSSSFIKKHLHTHIGIIDETFPLETNILFNYIIDSSLICEELTINFGDPIGQIIPIKRQEMKMEKISNLDIDNAFYSRNSERVGGFGSTDLK